MAELVIKIPDELEKQIEEIPEEDWSKSGPELKMQKVVEVFTR